MAFDEGVAERIREHLMERMDVDEKKMFGGLAFMVSGNMCCGVVDDTLMLRVGADQYETALNKPFAREMDFTGKPLRGFIYVEPAGFAEENDLQEWIEMALQFVTALPPK